MSPPTVVVLGAGVAGLTSALALARRGVPVDVLERDRGPAPLGRRSAAGWLRDGVPQVAHGHVFAPGCHRLLAAELPDVLALLLELGARRIEVPDPDGPDGTGVALAMRRPLFDWVLRRTAERESALRVHAGAAATGLRIEGAGLSGVAACGGVLAADVLVDATGACGPVGGWLADLGYRASADMDLPAPRSRSGPRRSSEAHYSRSYALRWPGDPTELNLGAAVGGGFDGYDCHLVPADNSTFTVTFSVPADDPAGPDLAALRMPDPFQIAAQRLPLVAEWVHPCVADPMTGVSVLDGWPPVPPVRQLRNSISLRGLISIGDARGPRSRADGNGVFAAMRLALACAEAMLAGGADALVALDQIGEHAAALPAAPTGVARTDRAQAGPTAQELAALLVAGDPEPVAALP